MTERSRPAVLVTGATSGIGAALCRQLSSSYTVLAHVHRNRTRAAELQREIRELGGACHLLHADLSDPDGPRGLAREVLSLVGDGREVHLHGIVNNAATLIGPPLDEITAKDFDQIFAINTRAPLLLIADLLGGMSAGGSIVNISSASAHISSPGNVLYAMSKASLESLTINLAEAIAPMGIRINAVVPGFTDNGDPAFQDDAALSYMSSFSVLGGVASPGVVAQAVLFLLSSASDRTTGSLLDVSGGTTLRPRGNRAKSVRDVLPKPR